MKLLSVIVPCFNEQEAMPIFYNEIVKVADTMKECVDFEVIFVDDGSRDNTLLVARELNDKDKRIKYISFSRNFGKESAIYAGLEQAKGDYIAIMDVDLQDPPKLLVDMYRGIVNEEYDCIATRRVSRKGEPPIRSFFARRFYSLINKISKTEIVDGARDYRLMTKQMVDSILELKEYNRFSKGIFSWVGYKTKWLEYENVERVAGETKWSFWKLFIYSLEGIIAFSTVPLAMASVFGMIFCLAAFVIICFVVAKTLIFGDPVAGYPSLICAITFIGGIQLFCIGILGQYLSKTYLETKQRPIYIAKERSLD
ncbi:glycosyltransferase involved in cell wall biosynthesis [Clostridium punense]|uniref:Glycosyltransferase involved in cell wall biosynthesis n=1 Tax=Clostridium punense TaxID=1054297 RepID=A0ABS4K3F2_9CLOT|nr:MULTISPECIES: glycosyltransferase family 2 protein [Clostridium]EQB87794.1 bactoprenol glucosyl transferase [Clostridium sp. BL8]MBP2022319.1 glycosyltransferase involved in cell wall biosynthesis [Clostridium punense]